MVLEGDAYWVKIRDAQLRVKELWWVPSCLVTAKWPDSGNVFISHYEYRPGGDPIRVSVDDVVHFRYGIDPDNERKGLSPLRSVLREVMSDDEASRFATSILRNMGVPGLIVSPDGDFAVDEDDMEATKAEIKERFGGDNRGEPFVTSGPTKVHQFGFSPEQMDMRTLRRVPEERVSGVIGVAAIVAGLGAGLDRSTFANFAEAREASYEGAVIPVQRLCSSELKHQLLIDFEPNVTKLRVRFNLKEVRTLQEDENKLVERKLKELAAGTILLSEYRAETGRTVKPEHDVYLRSSAIEEVRAEDLGKEPPPPPPMVPPGAGDPAVDAEKPPVEKPPETQAPAAPNGNGKHRHLPNVKGKSAEQRRLMELYGTQLEQLATVPEPDLVLIFESLGAVAEGAYITDAPKGRKADDVSDRDRVAAILGRMKGELATHQARIRATNEAHYQRVAQATVGGLNDVYQLNVMLPDEAARQILSEGGRRAGLIDLRAQTRDALYRSLAEGAVLGESTDQLARRIRSQVASGRFSLAGPSYRAKLIARTETRFAQNISAMAAYNAAGATGLLAFDSQGSGKSDPDCEERDGQTFSFADAESALADEHPNGTLNFAPVFD
jgi:HK97 family phage portal protein